MFVLVNNMNNLKFDIFEILIVILLNLYNIKPFDVDRSLTQVHTVKMLVDSGYEVMGAFLL